MASWGKSNGGSAASRLANMSPEERKKALEKAKARQNSVAKAAQDKARQEAEQKARLEAFQRELEEEARLEAFQRELEEEARAQREAGRAQRQREEQEEREFQAWLDDWARKELSNEDELEDIAEGEEKNEE